MTNQINDGGPAFPGVEYKRTGDECGVSVMTIVGGMTLRQYAAIKLAVPNSGLPWLDEMIVRSNRERLAAAALQGILSNADASKAWNESDVARFCYFQSDAMLKAREAKP